MQAIRTMTESATGPATPQPSVRIRLGLSGKLLLLTLLFVMIAEVMIYVPSVANYRLMWLNDRLAAARTAALVLDAAPDGMVSESLARQLLDSVGASAVAMKRGNTRRLLASPDFTPEVDQHVDMRGQTIIGAIDDAFQTLLASDGRVLRVVGEAPRGGDFMEIVIPEWPLRHAMLRYSRDILLLSLLISGISAALVYMSLLWMFVRPLRRLTARMVAFGQAPEDPARIVTPSARGDEIGIAERELAEMQKELAGTLQHKNRLASLGIAVSKINHDLRNLLSAAQLLSDRLAGLADPTVRRLAPKLMATLGRAIAYCEQTLAYGRAQEPPPERKDVDVAKLVEEVRDSFDLGVPGAAIGWMPSIERGLRVDADPDQLLRVLINLVHNSVEALQSRAPTDPERDQIRIVGRREGTVVVLQVADTGPGLPERARAHLFEPFQGSARRGGTGLGLAIAAEVVRAHGGEIQLVSGTIGATFRIVIPDRPVALEERRAERARA
jgi:signal transduction histidine kinase